MECMSSLPSVDYLERERGIIGFLTAFLSLLLNLNLTFEISVWPDVCLGQFPCLFLKFFRSPKFLFAIFRSSYPLLYYSQ